MVALAEHEITDFVRNQIVQDVTSKVLNYCKYPDGVQLQVVARKIVEALPVLKDSLGTGHVSLSLITETQVAVAIVSLDIAIVL